ncbi:MAG: hypothetical protein K2X53_05955 [Alphaproteobacteria bacterium]|nr:hypothetical protein [Alphaproteobacteria bacterium]
MTTVNTVNLQASLKNLSSNPENKVKTGGFKENAQVPNTLETQVITHPSAVAAGPKIITQIEASVLVTQTVHDDGTMSQFPKQGVVDYYIKSQQDLADKGDLSVLPNPTITDKA